METLAKLKEILSECKGEELDVNMDTTFDELDFDSLDKVDIVMQIEEAYDISLGDNMALSTVGELVKKIDEAVAKQVSKRYYADKINEITSYRAPRYPGRHGVDRGRVARERRFQRRAASASFPP